jgi:hypothetical protein
MSEETMNKNVLIIIHDEEEALIVLKARNGPVYHTVTHFSS